MYCNRLRSRYSERSLSLRNTAIWSCLRAWYTFAAHDDEAGAGAEVGDEVDAGTDPKDEDEDKNENEDIKELDADIALRSSYEGTDITFWSEKVTFLVAVTRTLIEIAEQYHDVLSSSAR